MSHNKGDLVLISDGDVTSTCIILTEEHHSMASSGFFYTYCLETGLYGIVYTSEIVSVVSKGFAPDFEVDSPLFDGNYKYYSDLYENFSYFPDLFPYDFSFTMDEEIERYLSGSFEANDDEIP